LAPAIRSPLNKPSCFDRSRGDGRQTVTETRQPSNEADLDFIHFECYDSIQKFDPWFPGTAKLLVTVSQPGSRSIGIIDMAIVGAALCPRDFLERARGQPHLRLKSLAPALLTICVVLYSLSLTGCARHPPPREAGPAVQERKPPPARAAVRTGRAPEPYRHVEPVVRRPDPALLSPQREPDCTFQRSDFKTVDPAEWARLQIEYERKCYQEAEKAARGRLTLLQASSKCEIEPAGQPRPVRRPTAQPQ
jgi:hypothetical protein